MDPYMVEVYRYLRDHAKPVSQQDAADLAKVRTFHPPSKARIKRLLNHRKLGRGNYVPAPRPYAPPSPETQARHVMLDFHKQQKALLGGTRTVAPAPDAVYRPSRFLTVVPPTRSTELYPEPKPFSFMTVERATSIARKHLLELHKNGHEVDMERVLLAFGSWECFGREVTKYETRA